MGYRWSLFSTFLLYALTILGALVVGLNAGFVCPNWPLCDGSLIPPLHGLVLVEYMHRLTVFLASVFILYNAWRSWRKRRGDKLVARLSLASVLLFVLQSALGAIIVVLVLPGPFTTVDVGNSLLLLSVLAALTAVGVKERSDLRQPPETEATVYQAVARTVKWPAIVAWVLILTQTLIGGYFRHSGDSQALYGQDSYLLSHKEQGMPTLTASTMWLIIHIGFTAAVIAGLIWLILRASKARRYRFSAVALLILTVYQALVGFVSLQTKLALAPDTLHWSGAALMVTISAYEMTLVLLDVYPRQIIETSQAVRLKIRRKKQSTVSQS